MANRDLPRRGSRQANALSALLSLGGKASVHTLYRIGGKSISRLNFDVIVIEQLVFYGLVKKIEGEVELTEAGRVHLGVAKPVEAYVGKVPEPRVGIGFRPLRARSPMVIREGAFDYRDIPSVMAGHRIPYRP
ncbi:hypothetical protein GM658_12475 [Pseudoduganella eburnea]|uniref:Uncharacterized protein n=1 Tax=Massilia eburnea TaxID=1776165 RepID=A0A6L6QGC7_9BURK|nr:hypothetical protein [Massilia eburnea]MTW11412.1 hypothetical protein [Massilia eburnea]